MTYIIHCKTVFSFCLNTDDGSGWKYSLCYIPVNAVTQEYPVGDWEVWQRPSLG